MAEVYLALGSNLGDREKNLLAAIDKLVNHSQIDFIAKSSWHENPAIEGAGPQDFLNGVIKIDTSLNPRELLNYINDVEAEIDPERSERGRKLARYIDIDILTYDDLKISEPDLSIPHPRMNERSFVTKPLNELIVKEYAEEIETNINEKLQLGIYNRLNKIEDFNIRRMYLSDLDRVLQISEQAFGEKHWSRNVFLQELANEKSLYLVAEANDNDQILGFAGVNLVLDEMHLLAIATDQEHKRKKIAESLLLALIDTALRSKLQTITLEVRAENEAAINLYKKYGFEYQGMRKQYYEDGADAAIYTVNLNLLLRI